MEKLHVLIDGMQISRAEGTGLKNYALAILRAHEHLGIHSSALFETHQSANPCLNALLLAEGTIPPQKWSRLGKRLVSSVTGAGSAILPMACDFSRLLERERPRFGNLGTYQLTTCFKDSGTLLRKYHTSLLASFPGKLDLWHSTFPLPIDIKRVPKVTTIHDLIALKAPHFTLTPKRNKYDLLKKSIEDSDALIAVSQQTKQDILDYFPGTPEEKIHVSYMTPSFTPLPDRENAEKNVLDQLNLESGEYILFLANIEPKKNVRRLLDAFAKLDTTLPLVIAGKKAWLYEDQLVRLTYDKRLAARIRFLGYIPDDYRPALYKGARCFVFPSICEGFGIPPLDALACGCPVVASHIQVLKEICGDAAHYVDPYDIDDILKGMEKVIGDSDYRKSLAAKGLERASFFTQEKHSASIAKAYQAALGC